MKKVLPLIGILLIASFVLAACQPAATATPETPVAEPTTPPAEEEPTAVVEEPTAVPEEGLTGTITLWHAWKENEIASLNEVIAGFQALNPNVTFDVLYVPFDDLRGKFETAAGTGGGPTVLIGAADWGPGLYDSMFVADLTPLASEEFLATINPAALGAVQYKDALVGLPQTLKGVLMFRNKSIVAEPATDFDDLVAKATAADTADIQGAALEYGLFFSAGHLYGLGGTLLTPEGDPAFNNEKGIEWANLIARFKETGPTYNNVDDDVALFKSGRAGIIIDGSWNISALADAIGADNLAIDPWPTPLSGFVQTENIYLNANATGADAEAGYAFMEYFLSVEAQTLLSDPTKAGHIPAVAGVEVTDPLMMAATEAFAGGAPFPVIPEMNAYWDAVNNALKKVVDEGTDPAVALQEAYELVVAKVAEIRGQ